MEGLEQWSLAVMAVYVMSVVLTFVIWGAVLGWMGREPVCTYGQSATLPGRLVCAVGGAGGGCMIAALVLIVSGMVLAALGFGIAMLHSVFLG